MFGNDSDPTRIWSYGADAPQGHDMELAEAQYRAAHRYRNELCAIELKRRQDCEAALREYAPDLHALDDAVTVAEAALNDALTVIKALRAETRKRVSTPGARANVKNLRKDLKEAREALKVRRKALYANEDFKACLVAVKEANAEAKRQARANTEAFWGSYLPVEQAMKDAGKGPPPRFLRWRGDGKLAVQLQKGMTMAQMFEAKDTRFRLVRTGGTDATAYLRVGSEGKRKSPVWIKVEVCLHRMPPSDAMLKWVYLIRRREGTHYRYWLQLILSRKEGWDRPDAAVTGQVALDLGWRWVGNDLRAAYWLGSDGQEGALFLSADFVRRYHFPEQLRSTRDKLFNGMRDTLCAWLRNEAVEPPWLGIRLAWLRERIGGSPPAEARKAKIWGHGQRAMIVERDALQALRANWTGLVGELAPEMRDKFKPHGQTETPTTAQCPTLLTHWRSTARLAGVALHWREHRFPGDELIFDVLESWRKRDKHIYDWEGALRAKLIRWRNDYYCKFACMLMRKYREVILPNINYREMAEKKPVEDKAESPALKENRNAAAAGRLAELLRERMRDGRVDPKHLTMRCSECGRMDAFDAAVELERRCQHCGSKVDQGLRLCKNLLAAVAAGNVEYRAARSNKDETAATDEAPGENVEE